MEVSRCRHADLIQNGLFAVPDAIASWSAPWLGSYPLQEAEPLVAPYCAIPRDYLSDTPLLRAMGFLVSQHSQFGAMPPPLFCAKPPSSFLRVSPLESMRSGGAIPPPHKGYLSDTCAIPSENKANGCDTPSAILSRKGIAQHGGVSRIGPLRQNLTMKFMSA